MRIHIAIAILAVTVLASCTGTKAAYQAADSLPNTAFVIAEHYSALLNEAATLKESGRVPANLLDAMRKADDAIRPLIVGDPSAVPPIVGLRDLAASYQAVRDAETEAQLQVAVDNALREIAKFINTVKLARGAL